MSSKKLFQTLNQQSLLESQCGISIGKALTFARDQIRVELHSQGFSWGRLCGTQWEWGNFEIADSYENSLKLFQQKIASRSLIRNGQVLITNLWSPNFQIQPIHQQLSQKFNSLSELDLTAQVAPSQLNLTPGFIYRTIEKKADRSTIKNGDLIGIPIIGIESTESALPRITKVSRHWGPLSVLQVIVNRFSMELPESLLLGIIDAHRVYYISIRKLQLSGLRSSVRSSLRDTGDLHSTITSLGRETSCILFVNLTNNSEDLISIVQELEKNKKWTIRTMGRAELLQAFPELQNFSLAPLFPLSLLFDRSLRTPTEIPSPSFVTPQEALSPQITSMQGGLLRSFRLFRMVLFLFSLSILSWGGYKIYAQLSSPEWNVSGELARQTKIKYEQFIQDSQEYQKKYKTLKSFPRFDLIAHPLLVPGPQGVTLDEIKFISKSAPKSKSDRSFELSIQGTMLNGDLLKLREYANHLEIQIQENLPDFIIKVIDSGLTEKTNSSGAAFRLIVKIESKNHGSI